MLILVWVVVEMRGGGREKGGCGKKQYDSKYTPFCPDSNVSTVIVSNITDMYRTSVQCSMPNNAALGADADT
jgi:hypothetical protein